MALRGNIYYQHSLAKHTSWRVGGFAKCFYQPADRFDLIDFLQQLPKDEVIICLGLGSNLLIRDGGLDATVIASFSGLSALKPLAHHQLSVEAGVPCAKVAKQCARWGFGGMEFLAGIPGTIGGALAMNAGAFGSETWDWVIEVETINRHAQIQVKTPQDFRIAYRSVTGLKDEWFLSARLQLKPVDSDVSQQKIQTLLQQRSLSQPTQWPNGGSVFRNPKGDYAARLIETAGLKGKKIGGACVSEKHANFIINQDHANAWDIEQLILFVQQQVKQCHGVALIPEVHIIGEFAQS